MAGARPDVGPGSVAGAVAKHVQAHPSRHVDDRRRARIGAPVVDFPFLGALALAVPLVEDRSSPPVVAARCACEPTGRSGTQRRAVARFRSARRVSRKGARPGRVVAMRRAGDRAQRLAARGSGAS
jgi:hypothetical protein